MSVYGAGRGRGDDDDDEKVGRQVGRRGADFMPTIGPCRPNVDGR